MPKENPAKGPATENFKRSSRFGTIFRILVIEPKDPICQKKLVRFFKHEYAQMTAKEYENKRYGQESEVGYYSCQWEIEENNALTENTHISMQPRSCPGLSSKARFTSLAELSGHFRKYDLSRKSRHLRIH